MTLATRAYSVLSRGRQNLGWIAERSAHRWASGRQYRYSQQCETGQSEAPQISRAYAEDQRFEQSREPGRSPNTNCQSHRRGQQNAAIDEARRCPQTLRPKPCGCRFRGFSAWQGMTTHHKCQQPPARVRGQRKRPRATWRVLARRSDMTHDLRGSADYPAELPALRGTPRVAQLGQSPSDRLRRKFAPTGFSILKAFCVSGR